MGGEPDWLLGITNGEKKEKKVPPKSMGTTVEA